MPDPMNPNDKTGQSNLYERLKAQEAQINELRDLVQKQSKMLQEPKSTDQPPQPPKPRQIKTADDLFEAINETVEKQVTGYLSSFADTIMPIIKGGNDPEILKAQELAQKYLGEGKVSDMETALRLAKLDLQEQSKSDDELMKATAAEEAREKVLQATMGHRTTTSTSMSHTPEGKDLYAIMNAKYEANEGDIQGALDRLDGEIDIWTGGGSGVNPIIGEKLS